MKKYEKIVFEIDFDKGMKLLDSFSEEEFILNGHKKENISFLFNQYAELMGYLKKGRYIEMGCGTGMLCRLISDLSKKKIIPYGIDKDERKIKIAKKNNPEFSKNFTVADFLKLDMGKMPHFSTAVIFVANVKDCWKKTGDSIFPMVESGKISRAIVFSYDKNLLKCRDSEFKKFISAAGKNFKIDLLNSNFLIIEKK